MNHHDAERLHESVTFIAMSKIEQVILSTFTGKYAFKFSYKFQAGFEGEFVDALLDDG